MNYFPRSRVVVPIDFSDRSVEALSVAVQLVEKPADLYLLHVLGRAPDFDPTLAHDPERDLRRRETALSFMQRRYIRGGTVGANAEVRIGRPGREIPAFAEEVGADMLVMSSRGLTGMEHDRIGSVAEVAIRFAHCPVLVLRD